MYGPKYYRLMRGDPGFFGSVGKFLGGAVKTLAPIAIGVATGGVGGIAAKGLLGVAAKTGLGKVVGKIGGGVLGKIGARVVPGAGVVAGGATGSALASTALTKFAPPLLQVPAGLAGRGIFGAATGGAIAGGAVGAYGLTKKGTPRMRRRGRMNPLNPRAARRAITRIRSVNKLCSRIQAQLPKRRGSRISSGR